MSGDMPEALGVIVMWVAAASVIVPIVVVVAAFLLVALLVKLVFTATWNLVDPPSARELRRVDRAEQAAVKRLLDIRWQAVRRMHEIAEEDVIEGRGR